MSNYNHIKWCFVTKGGSVARLSWWSDKALIWGYLQSHDVHWVEL